jgi:hypothetical protein
MTTNVTLIILVFFFNVAYNTGMKNAACHLGFFYVLQALKPQA